MLYPRLTKSGELIDEGQMVSYREHLTCQHRLLFMSGTITGETESHNLLMALDSLSHDPIRLVITSSGGELDSTFLFYDTMKLIRSPVITLGRHCASAAALLLSAGDKRYLMPHAKVMLHLPSAQFPYSDTKDMAIRYAEMNRYQDRILDILVNAGVQRTKAEILEDIDREFWMTAEEAIAYGLADEVMTQDVLGGWLGNDE